MKIARPLLVGLLTPLIWCSEPIPDAAIRTATVLAGPRLAKGQPRSEAPAAYSSWKALVEIADVEQISAILDDPACTDAGVAYALLGLRECESDRYEKYKAALGDRLDNKIALKNGCVAGEMTIREILTLEDFVVIDFLKHRFRAKASTPGDR
ncbi:MAG TPA: hypothetical protein VEL07_07770 [Planctomycetota bacterium]|nr:hypothetical protein [Planctomycetota bacterium]